MFMTVFAVLGKEYGDETVDTVDEVKVHEDSVVLYPCCLLTAIRYSELSSSTS